MDAIAHQPQTAPMAELDPATLAELDRMWEEKAADDEVEGWLRDCQQLVVDEAARMRAEIELWRPIQEQFCMRVDRWRPLPSRICGR